MSSGSDLAKRWTCIGLALTLLAGEARAQVKSSKPQSITIRNESPQTIPLQATRANREVESPWIDPKSEAHITLRPAVHYGMKLQVREDRKVKDVPLGKRHVAPGKPIVIRMNRVRIEKHIWNQEGLPEQLRWFSIFPPKDSIAPS